MAYTDPPTVVSGDPLTAAEVNVIGDDIRYLYGIALGTTLCGVKVTRSTAQSIADSTDTDVVFTAEALDAGGWWSTGSTVTVPSGAIPAGFTTIAALYIATIRFVASNVGGRTLYLAKNGTQVDSMSVSGLDGGDLTTVSLVGFDTFAAGDTIKVQARQNRGSALNIDLARLSIIRLAPAS